MKGFWDTDCIENIREKRKIAHFEQFHLFPQCFPKAFLSNVLKWVQVYVEKMVKWSNLILTFFSWVSLTKALQSPIQILEVHMKHISNLFQWYDWNHLYAENGIKWNFVVCVIKLHIPFVEHFFIWIRINQVVLQVFHLYRYLNTWSLKLLFSNR